MSHVRSARLCHAIPTHPDRRGVAPTGNGGFQTQLFYYKTKPAWLDVLALTYGFSTLTATRTSLTIKVAGEGQGSPGGREYQNAERRT